MFFYDSNYLKVGKYLKIVSVNNKCLTVILKNKSKLTVLGSELEIDYYDKNEINIKGLVKRIEIDYENT